MAAWRVSMPVLPRILCARVVLRLRFGELALARAFAAAFSSCLTRILAACVRAALGSELVKELREYEKARKERG